jgi:hypothetical protein
MACKEMSLSPDDRASAKRREHHQGTMNTQIDGSRGRSNPQSTSWAVAIGLATAILAMPAMANPPVVVFRGFTYPGLELLAVAGAVSGWLLTDRIATVRSERRALIGVTGLVLVFGLYAASGGGAAADVLLLGAAGGSLVRGGRRRSRDPAIIVILATVATWVAYDLTNVLHAPMRDLHSYLAAAGAELAGGSAYLQGPIATLPDGYNDPFVYPPMTLPLFEVLACLPLAFVEVAWLSISAAAVFIGLRLLGVRGRWVVLLFASPIFAVGLSVGNVAAFGFVCFALGYRFAAALVIGGFFKPQAGIPAIWGLRERRYREIGLGIALLALLVIASIPLTGLTAWRDWAVALGYFEQALDRYGLRGASLTRYFPVLVVVVLSVAAIGLALLRGGRNGLARFGLAAIVASPTLYIHGFSPLLPGAMTLRPEVFWFVWAIVAWDVWGVVPVSGGWVALIIVAAALLHSTGEDLRGPVDLTEEAADLHPAGAGAQIWPDR